MNTPTTFKDFLPNDPIYIGKKNGYKLFMCGTNPPKMTQTSKNIYLSCGIGRQNEPLFGILSKKYFCDITIISSDLDVIMNNQNEFDYYYGEKFLDFSKAILAKTNLHALHFFHRDVLASKYPFRFEREETDKEDRIDALSYYDVLTIYIDSVDFDVDEARIKEETELAHLMYCFIKKQVLNTNSLFDFKVANKVALYLSGSNKISETQLLDILR
jgi:hypothetical protein